MFGTKKLKAANESLTAENLALRHRLDVLVKEAEDRTAAEGMNAKRLVEAEAKVKDLTFESNKLKDLLADTKEELNKLKEELEQTKKELIQAKKGNLKKIDPANPIPVPVDPRKPVVKTVKPEVEDAKPAKTTTVKNAKTPTKPATKKKK